MKKILIFLWLISLMCFLTNSVLADTYNRQYLQNIEKYCDYCLNRQYDCDLCGKAIETALTYYRPIRNKSPEIHRAYCATLDHSCFTFPNLFKLNERRAEYNKYCIYGEK